MTTAEKLTKMADRLDLGTREVSRMPRPHGERPAYYLHTGTLGQTLVMLGPTYEAARKTLAEMAADRVAAG